MYSADSLGACVDFVCLPEVTHSTTLLVLATEQINVSDNQYQSINIKNWTHVSMEFFTRNSPYYHLLKYLLFFLKHPVYIYIYIYIHPVAMLRMSGATVPSPYAFTDCTGTILATVTENFFHGFETVGNLKVASMPLGFRIFCRSPNTP
jgi:hypothetical protein